MRAFALGALLCAVFLGGWPASHGDRVDLKNPRRSVDTPRVLVVVKKEWPDVRFRKGARP